MGPNGLLHSMGSTHSLVESIVPKTMKNLVYKITGIQEEIQGKEKHENITCDETT
jgi:hypothetical protein